MIVAPLQQRINKQCEIAAHFTASFFLKQSFHIRIYTHTKTHTLTHTHSRTHTHAHTHAYTFTHTLTHIHSSYLWQAGRRSLEMLVAPFQQLGESGAEIGPFHSVLLLEAVVPHLAAVLVVDRNLQNDLVHTFENLFEGEVDLNIKKNEFECVCAGGWGV